MLEVLCPFAPCPAWRGRPTSPAFGGGESRGGWRHSFLGDYLEGSRERAGSRPRRASRREELGCGEDDEADGQRGQQGLQSGRSSISGGASRRGLSTVPELDGDFWELQDDARHAYSWSISPTASMVPNMPPSPLSPLEAAQGTAASSSQSSRLPLRIQGVLQSFARDISQAARTHLGATVAVVIPQHISRPGEHELAMHGLHHPWDAQGWFSLTDGSALGLLQLTREEIHGTRRNMADPLGEESTDDLVVNHGQAKSLTRLQVRITQLLECRARDEHLRSRIRNAPLNEIRELLSEAVPGARVWPLHDPLVSRLIAFNVTRGRCQGGLCSMLRLDRGGRFLDIARWHYGEEVAFLYAWQAHYVNMLGIFVVLSLPFIMYRTSVGKGNISWWMFPHSVITVFFGLMVTEMWKAKVAILVHRWRAHVDTRGRWQRLVTRVLEDDLESIRAAALREGAQMRRAALEDGAKGRVTIAKAVEAFEERVGWSLPYRLKSVLDPSLEEEECLQDASRPYASRPAASQPVLTSSRPPRLPKLSAKQSSRVRLKELEESAAKACRDTLPVPGLWRGAPPPRTGGRPLRCADLLRTAKTLLILPIILAEWTIIMAFFSWIVWFEVWVIFDWGGCKEVNMKAGDDEWKCLSADQERGWLGAVVGALPSIFEGVFFELLMLVSKLTANLLIGLFEFRTGEQREFATVMVVFLLEVVGKIGFITTLGMGFVPTWDSLDWQDCRGNWDYALLGKRSLGCLKGQIPFEVRLKLFESCMKGPMLVSGLVSILIKTLLPGLLSLWRMCADRNYPSCPNCMCRCRRRRTRWGRCLMVPANFVLSVCLLIFQADSEAVGGLRLICRWPPWPEHVAEEDSPRRQFSHIGGARNVCREPNAMTQDEIRTKRASLRLHKLWSVLLEGEWREHNPFDEYIELLLHFLWTSCFAVVWPLGTVFALLNQLLEYRFDCLKLIAIRRRRFPSTRFMSLVWVPTCASIVCHVSIFVNVCLLTLPYQPLWVGVHDYTQEGQKVMKHVPVFGASHWPRILALFVSMYLCYEFMRFAALWTIGKATQFAKRLLDVVNAAADQVSDGASSPTPSVLGVGNESPCPPRRYVPFDSSAVDSLGMSSVQQQFSQLRQTVPPAWSVRRMMQGASAGPAARSPVMRAPGSDAHPLAE